MTNDRQPDDNAASLKASGERVDAAHYQPIAYHVMHTQCTFRAVVSNLIEITRLLYRRWKGNSPGHGCMSPLIDEGW